LWLPWSPVASALGLTVPPHAYWWGLGGILAAYAVTTQLAKAWLTRRFGID
jgi:Mg2+-importing ATPase